MAITFDQVDGVVQAAAEAPAEAATPAQSEAPAVDHTRIALELARAERRRERLRAD